MYYCTGVQTCTVLCTMYTCYVQTCTVLQNCSTFTVHVCTIVLLYCEIWIDKCPSNGHSIYMTNLF